jgi:MFS family permease
VLGGAVGQWPLGRISDRLDRRHVIIGAAALAAVIGIVIRYNTPTIGHGILIFALLYGITAFPLYSICAAHMNDHVTDGGYVEASSGLLLLFAGGAIIGPLIVAPLMNEFSPYALFSFTALVQGLLALFAFYRLYVRASVPKDARSRFVDALRDTQTVAPLASEDGASQGREVENEPPTTAPEESGDEQGEPQDEGPAPADR